ncbi:MAG: hypothetical protein ABIN00_02580 [candidate division WOR-3 bacterium]
MGKKQILVISYYLYPFYNYGGGRRFFSLLKFFDTNKIDYLVITSSEKTFLDHKTLFIKDPFVRGKRVDRGNSFLRSFNPLPDSMFLWSYQVFKYIKKHRKNFDKIIVSCPPFSLPLILSLFLKRKDFDKFILDVRDIYYDGTLRDYKIPLIRFIDYIFDRIIFKRFRKITTNIPRYVDLIKKRYKLERVDLVVNSLDDEEQRLEKINFKEKVMLYSGKLDRFRFNKDFFEIFEKISPRIDFKIFIAGKVDEKIKDYLEKKSFVKLLGELDYRETQKYVFSSDIFLIMHPFDLKDGQSIFSSKLLDGIKFKKKILYVGPENDVYIFVKDNKIGEVISKSDAGDLEQKLKRLLENEYHYNDSIFEKFKQPFKNSYFTENLF